MSVTAMVSRRRLPRKMSVNRPGPGRDRRPAGAPEGWLLDPPLDPDGEQRRQHTDEEHGPPSPDGHDDGHHDGREPVADCPGALHEAEGLAAVFGRPGLGDQRRAACPLPSHAEPQEHAEHGKLGHGLRQSAGGGEHGVDEDARDQGALPPVAVRHDAEGEAADGRRHERQGPQQAGGELRHLEVFHERGEHERVEHHVEAVEHPAEAARHQRAPAFRGPGPPPGHESAIAIVHPHRVSPSAILQRRIPRGRHRRSPAIPRRRARGRRARPSVRARDSASSSPR